MKTDIPFAELDVPSIAKWCKERRYEARREDQYEIEHYIYQLFDHRREKVHDAIYALGILLSDEYLQDVKSLPTA